MTKTNLMTTALIYLSFVAIGQQTPNTNRTTVLPTRSAEVGVFFGNREVLSVREIENRARKALKERGFEVSEAYSCAINISLGSSRSPCVVLFSLNIGSNYYEVDFNTSGKVMKIYNGVAKEGVSPGGPKPTVPAGAVRISDGH